MALRDGTVLPSSVSSRDKSDQSWGVKQVSDAKDTQTADTSSDPTAVLQLAERKRLTLRQVELNVLLRQSL